MSYAKVKIKIFYMCINLGCLSPVATTVMEQSTGFWTAYLLCLCFFIFGIAILMAGKRHYVVHPPKGSVIINAFRAMWVGLRNGGNMGESTAVIASASLPYSPLIRLQRLRSPHTKMSADASTKHHGTTIISMSSSGGLRHVVSFYFTQSTGPPTRKS